MKSNHEKQALIKKSIFDQYNVKNNRKIENYFLELLLNF